MVGRESNNNGAETMTLNPEIATFEAVIETTNLIKASLPYLNNLPADTAELVDGLILRLEVAHARGLQMKLEREAAAEAAKVVDFPRSMGVLEGERAAARRAGELAVAEEAEAKAAFLAASARRAPGKATTVELEEGQWATVTPRASIRLHGVDRNRVNGPVAYDRTFAVGDSAEYDSYNTSFIGRIVAIGAKTVTIEAHGERRRLRLEQFSWRNRHFDLETVAARNAEESYFI